MNTVYHQSPQSKNRAAEKWKKNLKTAAVLLAFALGLQTALRYIFFYPVTISSDSMSPQIRFGEKKYFIYASLSAPHRNDAVLVNSEYSEAGHFCRIVALESEAVSIKGGVIHVNGQILRDLKLPLASAAIGAREMPEMIVRADHFFCLNDDATDLNDSRMWGAFQLRQIQSKLTNPFFLF